VAELEVAEPEFVQDGDLAGDRRLVLEERDPLLHGQVEDLGDVLAPVFDLESVLVVAGPLARGADDFHVGHEGELRGDRSFAGALLAAAALDVEAEGRGGEAAPAGRLGLGEQRADRVIEPDVRRRVGPLGPPDRGLVDVDHVADVLAAGQRVVRAGEDAAVVQQRIETLVYDLVNQ